MSILLLILSISIQTEGEPVLEPYKIIVEVSDLRNDQGNLLLSVYDNEEGFPGEGEYAIKSLNSTILDGKAQFQFELPKGEYAISVLHDENGNNKLDASMLGLPKEGIGVSNNPKSFMGPPKYKKAKFKVQKDMLIKINMLYL